MSKIAVNYAETPAQKAKSAPVPVNAAKPEPASKPFSKPSFARKKLEQLFSAGRRVMDRRRDSFTPPPEAPVVVPVKKEPKFTPPAVPASGRVLRGSFGAKPSDEAKAKVYSVAELERLRMEERAKKIRAELAAKNKAAAPVPLGPDGQPVKRPRGRPRKNPLPESPEV